MRSPAPLMAFALCCVVAGCGVLDLLPSRERPPQPILTSQIAWRVDLFHPVSKESGHGAAGRSAEVCGVASAAAAL